MPHLGIGGAQQVVRTLARHLDGKGYEVHLALLTQSADRGGLPPSVQIYCLGAKRARYAMVRLIGLLVQLRPQFVFVGMAHLAPFVLVLRVLLPARTRMIVRQNGSVSSVLNTMGPATLSRALLAAAYRQADLVVCQTRSTAEELQTRLRLNHARVQVLPNPVDIETIRRAVLDPNQNLESSRPYFLAVGRLEPEKGFDLLLDAFGGLKRVFPRFRLCIAGSGSCRSALESQSKNLGIEHLVEFLGEVHSPSKLFPGAAAFVLPSREDELPNALLEAAAAGMPIIATPASRGLTDLLSGCPGVWLARDVTARALEETLREAIACIGSSPRFRHEWVEPFELSTALAAYEEAFEHVLNGPVA